MITFFVEGTPIAQGSKIAWCPTARNADVNDAIYALRNHSGTPAARKLANETADRLEAIGKWPIYIPAKDPAKNGRWLANLRESSDKKLKPWRQAITAAAKEAFNGYPAAKQGVRVDIVFYFRRPKIHYRTGKFASILRDDCPSKWDHFQKPDRDKLNRAVGDALTGIIFVDDSQDCNGISTKVWNDSRDEPEGAKITITWRDEW